MYVNHFFLADAGNTALSGNLFRKQLLKYGEWVHPNDPTRKMTITKELVKKLIENFKAKVLDKVPVPNTHTNSALANTGYVVGLEETSDGLDAIIEITDETALDKLRKKLIPGISAAFHSNYTVKDSGTQVGPVLLHAALVDNPYIKGLRDFQPIALGDDDKSTHIPFILSEGVKEMTKEQLITALKEQGVDVVELMDKAGKLDKANTDLQAAQAVITEVKTAFGDVIQLADNTSPAEGVKQLVAKVKAKETEVTQLSDRVGNLERTIKTNEAKSAVALLVKDTKIAPADVEKYEKLYLSDKSLFDGITATLKPVVQLGELGTDPAKVPGANNLDTEAEIKRIAEEMGLK